MVVSQPLHPALKLARPSLLVGGVLVVIGALIWRGFIALEPSAIWAISIGVPGLGLMVFGFTVSAAGRMLAGIVASQDAENKD